MIAFSVVDLPAPLRPISATTSPRRTCEVDVEEDLRRAVPGARGALRPRAAARRCRAHAGHAAPPALASRRSCRCRSRPPAPSGWSRISPRRALGDQPAARQHDDAVGVGEHHVHAVLGEQHRRCRARRTSRLVSAISSLRSFGAMPAVGSSISSSLRRVGQRDRQLDPLDVAVGQHAARRGRPAPPCRPARAARAPRRACGRRRGASSREQPAGRARAAPSARSRPPSARRRSRRSGRCGRRPGARSRAACRPTQLGPSSRIEPASARELAVDHVEGGRLAGAVGADQRQQLAGGERRS